MATPTGITLNNFDVIIEASTDSEINTSVNGDFAGGYVRQIGTLVDNCEVDDFVQYKLKEAIPFIQAAVTFFWVNQKNILFIQAPLP